MAKQKEQPAAPAAMIPAAQPAPPPPMTVDQVEGLARLMAASKFFMDARDAAQAGVKILAGRELGFGPVASMTGIYVVKGRVTVSANLMAAAIRRSGRYDYRVTRLDEQGCQVQFYMHGEPCGESSFSMEDARKAGLAGGDNWKKYPRNMLFARAMSNGAKWYCPDVFGGPVYTPDEAGARVDEQGETVIDVPAEDVKVVRGKEKAPAAARPQEAPDPAGGTVTHEQLTLLAGLREALFEDTKVAPADRPAEWQKILAKRGVDSATKLTSAQADELISSMRWYLDATDMEALLGPSGDDDEEAE